MWGWGPAGRQRAVCTKTSQQASHPPFGVISLLMISSRKVKTSLPACLALPTCDGALSVFRMSLLPSGLQAGSSGMCGPECRKPLPPRRWSEVPASPGGGGGRTGLSTSLLDGLCTTQHRAGPMSRRLHHQESVTERSRPGHPHLPLLVLRPWPAQCACQLRSGGGTCKAGKGMGNRGAESKRSTGRGCTQWRWAAGHPWRRGQRGAHLLPAPQLHSTWSCLRRAENLPRPVQGLGQPCCPVFSEVKVPFKKNVGHKEVTDAW